MKVLVRKEMEIEIRPKSGTDHPDIFCLRPVVRELSEGLGARQSRVVTIVATWEDEK